MNEPTEEGTRRWPPDGYLLLDRAGDARSKLACTCTAACCDPDCKGKCGCEACALGWLIYQDDQALWDGNGNLVNVVDIESIVSASQIPISCVCGFRVEE